MASRLYSWLDSRLKLKPLQQTLLEEPIPGGGSWVYIFGSATLFLFVLQALTGMCLAIYYVPSPDAAYDSVQFIQKEVSFGWFIRGLHHWGASAIMLAIGLHILQVFLYGAYKPPREVMWMVGVILLLLMLTFGFTGYLLPWDQNAYWATQVGTNMVASAPIVGDFLVRVLRGGEGLGALTLSRFFALHILFLPSLLITGIALHLFILRRVGPAGPWDDARARQHSEPFYPRQVYMDAVGMLMAFVAIVILALTIEFPLADRADPSDHTFTPVPEWYFLFFYQLLKYIPGPLEPVATWMLPSAVILVLLFLPFLDRNPNRRPVTRPIVLLCGSLFLGIVFTLLGISLWNLHAMPRMDPSVAHGQALFSRHHCTACHRIHGNGGKVGPDLSYVGDSRPDRQWHIRHLRDPKSVSPGSPMPQFNLSDKELNDLASYLLSLKGQPSPSDHKDASSHSRSSEHSPTQTGGRPSTGTEASAPVQSPRTQGEGVSMQEKSGTQTARKEAVPSVARNPTDLPPPIGRRAPQHIKVDLEAIELEGRLEEGATYSYMTFNGKVPGPFIRVRLDDTVELHLTNRSSNQLSHSIDLHAVTGTGGGSSMTQTAPGGKTSVTFKAIKPGLFVYHCATAMVSEHISSGMYGLILVEPAIGLGKVDHEFYVMQGELYTRQLFGEYGHQEFSRRKLLSESPEYVIFNGAMGALTKEYPLQAKVGQTARIFFGVGGPNFISSFHLIGEHWDRVFDQASLTSPPLTNVQTTLVSPGGATVVEFALEVPGQFLLVDHALSRLEHGLMGILKVEGATRPDIFLEHKKGHDRPAEKQTS